MTLDLAYKEPSYTYQALILLSIMFKFPGTKYNLLGAALTASW